MSTQYEGDETDYPDDVYIADDGAAPTAGEFNPGLEGALDRTAFLARYARQLSALNFFDSGQIIVGGSPLDCQLAVWDSFYRRWWMACAGVGRVYYSSDSARAFPAYVAVTGIISTAAAVAGDFDDAGNGVIGCSSFPTFSTHDDKSYWECTAGVWTRRTLAAFSADGHTAGVVYDPVHAKWVAVQVSSTFAVVATYSSNRVAWTASALPAAFGSGIFQTAVACAVRKDTGRILTVAHKGSADTFYVAASDDGGVTHAQIATMPSTGADPTDLTLTYVCRDTWVLVANRYTTTTAKAWRTTDNGATWTLVSTLASTRVRSIVAIEGVVVGYANDAAGAQFSVYSRDRGANWIYGNHQFATGGVTGENRYGVAKGGGQLVVAAGDVFWPGMRVGDPGAKLP